MRATKCASTTSDIIIWILSSRVNSGERKKQFGSKVAPKKKSWDQRKVGIKNSPEPKIVQNQKFSEQKQLEASTGALIPKYVQNDFFENHGRHENK